MYGPSESMQQWSQEAPTQLEAADNNQSGLPIFVHGEEFVQLHNYMDEYGHVLAIGGHVDYPPAHPDESLCANPLYYQGPYPSISETTLSFTSVASNTPKDTGTVLQRQRKPQKPRGKKGFLCQFQDDKCEFMLAKENGVFKNLAELKEDTLRHLNPFQCERCGKRFGKRYGKRRHIKKKRTPCTPVEEGGNSQEVVWVGRELKEAVVGLEAAKGGHEVMAAIDKCKKLCNLGRELKVRRREAQRRLSRHDNLVAMATDQTTATTFPGHIHGTQIPQEAGIQNSLVYSRSGSAPGFIQDSIAYGTPQQLSEYGEPGGPTYGTSVATSSAEVGIYMADKMELNQIPQGPPVDTNFNVEGLNIPEEVSPDPAQGPSFLTIDRLLANWGISNWRGGGGQTTPDLVPVNPMPTSSSTDYFPLPPRPYPFESNMGWHPRAHEESVSEHDTGAGIGAVASQDSRSYYMRQPAEVYGYSLGGYEGLLLKDGH